MRRNYVETSRLLANTLYQFCKEGLSMNIKLEEPTDGYMVSVIPGPIFDNVAAVDVGEIKKFIDNHDGPNFTFFGVWTDSETGKIYFDMSLCISEKERALKIASEKNQLAIWDVKNKCEIRL